MPRWEICRVEGAAEIVSFQMRSRFSRRVPVIIIPFDVETKQSAQTQYRLSHIKLSPRHHCICVILLTSLCVSKQQSPVPSHHCACRDYNSTPISITRGERFLLQWIQALPNGLRKHLRMCLHPAGCLGLQVASLGCFANMFGMSFLS